MHQNSEDAHRTGLPSKPSNYDHTSVSCIYDKPEGAGGKPEQKQQHNMSITVSSRNIHLYSKESQDLPKAEANLSGSQGPKVLVEYDNFPPNKTIGPEMKVVIPPIPSQNTFSRSSPKDNGCQMQYTQGRATGDQFSHFSPIHTTEEFTDSDSDWENEVGFGGFIWCVIRGMKMCIYCKIVIKLLLVKGKNCCFHLFSSIC